MLSDIAVLCFLKRIGGWHHSCLAEFLFLFEKTNGCSYWYHMRLSRMGRNHHNYDHRERCHHDATNIRRWKSLCTANNIEFYLSSSLNFNQRTMLRCTIQRDTVFSKVLHLVVHIIYLTFIRRRRNTGWKTTSTPEYILERQIGGWSDDASFASDQFK